MSGYKTALSAHFQCLQGLWAIHALVSITEQKPDAMPEFTIYYLSKTKLSHDV